MKRLFLALSIVALLNVAYCNGAPKASKKKSAKAKGSSEVVKVGKVLPAWNQGCLDIHFINSGRGECCFYILPDGTTLLVDAGEIKTSTTSVAQRPNDKVRPYMVYANYIKHFLPEGRKAIDYCLATHLHIDHIGSAECATETAPAGYLKSGLLALYDEVPYKIVLDSMYPSYDSYEIVGGFSPSWVKFVEWGVKSKKFTAEQFEVGIEQINMLYNAKKHKNFSIFNICANGMVWGKDKSGNVRPLGKPLTTLSNPASCGFHIRYGAFDYLACGDLTSSPQNRAAYYFRDFIGEGNLDAFKCHHHMAPNSWGSGMIKSNFNPRYIFNNCFAASQPNPEKLAYVLGWADGYFSSNIHPAVADIPLVKEQKLLNKITAYNGHMVLRVMPGGEEFYIYMLDDSNFEYKVKSIHGPYKSK